MLNLVNLLGNLTSTAASFACAGQVDREDGLYVGSTFDRDSAFMYMNDGLGNGEAQPGAGWWGSGVINGHVFATIEAIKDFGQIVRVNAFAVIDDLYYGVAVLPVELQANPAIRGGTAIFDGVIAENVDNLFQMVGVGFYS